MRRLVLECGQKWDSFAECWVNGCKLLLSGELLTYSLSLKLQLMVNAKNVNYLPQSQPSTKSESCILTKCNASLEQHFFKCIFKMFKQSQIHSKFTSIVKRTVSFRNNFRISCRSGIP